MQFCIAWIIYFSTEESLILTAQPHKLEMKTLHVWLAKVKLFGCLACVLTI